MNIVMEPVGASGRNYSKMLYKEGRRGGLDRKGKGT